MTARCQRGESSWLLLNRESRQLWWSLHHFRDNGMLEIGSGQHVKFIGEFQTLVQCLRHGFGLRQEICPQDIKGCSTASLLIYLFHISSDLRWCKRENRTQKSRDFTNKMVHKVESEMQSGPEQARILVNRGAEGLSDVGITMTNGGMVWFSSWVKLEHGSQLLNHVNRTWQSMREQMNQGLGELLPDGTCHICDLVSFVLNLRFRNQIGLKMLSLQQVFDKLCLAH